MTDNIDKPQGGDTDTPQGGSVPAQGVGVDPAQLQKQIDELLRDNKKYRDERKAQDAATKAANEKHLADQQKWEELAEARRIELDKLKPVADQYDSITAAFNASLDNRLKQIPEAVRAKMIDPIRAALSPVDFSNWLDANMSSFTLRQAPPMDAGAGGSSGGNGKGVTLTAEEMQMARAMNMTPERYAARKAERSNQQ